MWYFIHIYICVCVYIYIHIPYRQMQISNPTRNTHPHTMAVAPYELSGCGSTHALLIHWRIFYTRFVALCFLFLPKNVHVHPAIEGETHHVEYSSVRRNGILSCFRFDKLLICGVSFWFHYWATRMNWQRKQSTHDTPTGTSNMKCWLLQSTQRITKGTQKVSDSPNKPHGSADHILHAY